MSTQIHGRVDISHEEKRATSKSPLLASTYPSDDFYQGLATQLGVDRRQAKEAWLRYMYSGDRAGVSPLQKVAEFHSKFELPNFDQLAPRELTDEEALFRINFMLEELAEYAGCAGFKGVESYIKDFCHDICEHTQGRLNLPDLRREDARDMHGQLDALVDLSYVLHGTALFHGFARFDQAFDTVHAANMAKERATRPEQSKRGSTFDVIKPSGWTPPVLTEFLK